MDFLRRHSFWVVLGGLLVVAVAVHVLGVARLGRENARLSRDLAATDKQVKDLAVGGELRSEAWVKAAEQYETELQGEYQATLKLIEERAVDRYRTLPNIQPTDCVPRRDQEGQEYVLPTGAVFKTRYPEAVAELEAKLQGAQMLVGLQAIRLPRLAGEIPDDDRIVALQSWYWLLRDVVDALAGSGVPVDEVALLTEEFSAEGGPFGGPGGGMGEGAGMPAMPTEVASDFGSMMEAEGGPGGGGMAERFAGSDVGVTTAMQELFFGSQRRVRLVVQMDFRQLPLLLKGLTSMPRLTLVRSVNVYRVSPYGEAAVKPLVRVDIRALCFDRLSKFVPREVVQP
jgi:hypothetical protein